MEEFVKLIQFCEKDAVVDKEGLQGVAALASGHGRERGGHFRTGTSSSEYELLTRSTIEACFREIAQDDGTIDIHELDEFVRRYRQQVGTTNVQRRAREASVPLLQLGYTLDKQGTLMPHVSPRPHRHGGIAATTTAAAAAAAAASPRQQRRRSKPAAPTLDRPLKEGTYSVRKGRITTKVTMAASPKRQRRTVDVDKDRIGHTVSLREVEVGRRRKVEEGKDHMTEAEILSVLESWMDLHLLRVKDAFAAMDVNKSGGLSTQEFMEVFTKLGAHISSKQMVTMFEKIDDDGDGDITLSELRRHIRKSKTAAARGGISNVAARVVLEGGVAFNPVKFQEFESYTTLEAVNRVLVEIQTAVSRNEQLNLKAVFRDYDSDGGGSIDKEEFNQVLLAFKIQLTLKELDNVFAIFDPEGDGDISYLEFVYAVKNRADYVRSLQMADDKRKKLEKENDLKFFDDPTKIKGKVKMDLTNIDEEAMEWMRKTSEHTD